MLFAFHDSVSGLLKLIITTVCVLIAASAVAVFVAPPSNRETLMGRQGKARKLMDRLQQEIWNYYGDHGRYPPGDGTGSKELVRALSGPSKAGVPYMTFRPEDVTGMGDLRNPVSPENSIFYYRNNVDDGVDSSQGSNRGSFDLWCRDAVGWKMGLNNWDLGVPSP